MGMNVGIVEASTQCIDQTASTLDAGIVEHPHAGYFEHVG